MRIAVILIPLLLDFILLFPLFFFLQSVFRLLLTFSAPNVNNTGAKWQLDLEGLWAGRSVDVIADCMAVAEYLGWTSVGCPRDRTKPNRGMFEITWFVPA